MTFSSNGDFDALFEEARKYEGAAEKRTIEDVCVSLFVKRDLSVSLV